MRDVSAPVDAPPIAVLGAEEEALQGREHTTLRFVSVCLYPGVPDAMGRYAVGVGGAKEADVPIMDADGPKGPARDPTLLVTAHGQRRFYLFTRRPALETGAAPRDVMNEPPSKEEIQAAQAVARTRRAEKLGGEAIIHTTQGDIYVKLLGDAAPKAVENFCGHSRGGVLQ